MNKSIALLLVTLLLVSFAFAGERKSKKICINIKKLESLLRAANVKKQKKTNVLSAQSEWFMDKQFWEGVQRWMEEQKRIREEQERRAAEERRKQEEREKLRPDKSTSYVVEKPVWQLYLECSNPCLEKCENACAGKK